VESKFGKGTTFCFTLPKRELKETPDTARTMAKGQTKLASTV
jgi:hypothetical protein